MIQSLFNSGALPMLERVVEFTEQRHAVLTDDIANISTPYFKPRDLDTKAFQASLAEAVEQRRKAADPVMGPLTPRDTNDVRFGADGLTVDPQEANENILFHDQNNRDLERLMQHLAENTLTHRAAIEMIRGELNVIRTAIRERV